MSINLRQFTITAGGHETRGGSGKAKLKFRLGVSDRKEKTGTIEMTAEIVDETNNRVQSLLYVFVPEETLLQSLALNFLKTISRFLFRLFLQYFEHLLS